MILLVAISLFFAAMKGCQESYDLGTQATVPVDVTPEPTRGATDLITQVPTPEQTSMAHETASPTPTATLAPAVDHNPTAAESLWQDLSTLSEKSPEKRIKSKDTPLKKAVSDKRATAKGAVRFVKPTERYNSGNEFADRTKIQEILDPHHPQSTPRHNILSKLDDRVRRVDPDLDGLSTGEELRLGTDPHNMDTDQDGRTDGAEVLSGGDPKRGGDTYLDSDGDGLSDEYERANGLNPESLDSDNDGLRDDLELVIGSDPLKIDTDSDGISDSKEFDLGSDPTVFDSLPSRETVNNQ